MQTISSYATRVAAMFGAVAMSAFVLTAYFTPAASAAISTGFVA